MKKTVIVATWKLYNLKIAGIDRDVLQYHQAEGHYINCLHTHVCYKYTLLIWRDNLNC